MKKLHAQGNSVSSGAGIQPGFREPAFNYYLECFSNDCTVFVSSVERGLDESLKSYTISPSYLMFGGHKPWSNFMAQMWKVSCMPVSLLSCACSLSKGDTQGVLTGLAGLLALLDWTIEFKNPRNSIN